MTNFYRTLKLLLLEINTNKPKVTQNILKEIQAPHSAISHTRHAV